MRKLVIIPLAFVAIAATACDPRDVSNHVDHVRQVLEVPNVPARNSGAETPALERPEDPVLSNAAEPAAECSPLTNEPDSCGPADGPSPTTSASPTVTVCVESNDCAPTCGQSNGCPPTPLPARPQPPVCGSNGCDVESPPPSSGNEP